MEERFSHTFEPIYDAQSRILILGSFPSEESRKQHFYYSHPRNRFWRLLAALFDTELPETIQDKKLFLLTHSIALYDAVQSCTVTKSDDASIRDIIPADLHTILNSAPICRIFTNGTKAYEVCSKQLGLETIRLPSTSAANARFSFEDLLRSWKIILEPLIATTP